MTAASPALPPRDDDADAREAEALPASAVRLAPGLSVPEGVLTFTFSSSSGPGGQNVNKRATKCLLRVPLAALPLTAAQAGRLRRLAPSAVTDAGELLITGDEHRSQPRNKSECIDRLRDLVRRSLVAPKVRRATKPTRGSKERRLAAKKRTGETKARRRSSEE